MVKKVLLADDEEEVLEMLAATLGDDVRYRLLLAKDGEETLAMARREKPDLLLLDIAMPKMSGYEVCQVLKSHPSTTRVKVVMLTGLTQGSERQRSVEAGADDYITKPFSPTMLLEKVENLLGLQRMESQALRHEEPGSGVAVNRQPRREKV